MKKFFKNFCERGQACSCFFDGWWGKACKKHDELYMTPKGKGMKKFIVDLILFWEVVTAVLYLAPFGLVIGLGMFLVLTFCPKAYRNWNKYKKERNT